MHCNILTSVNVNDDDNEENVLLIFRKPDLVWIESFSEHMRTKKLSSPETAAPAPSAIQQCVLHLDKWEHKTVCNIWI